jgi:SHAQKYF class myb-like DNA-binding protein
MLQNKQPQNLLSSNANNNKTQTDTQIITISNNSNPSNFAKGTINTDPNAAPIPKTIKLKLSIIRAPHATTVCSVPNPSKVSINHGNSKNSALNSSVSLPNSILNKIENNLSSTDSNKNGNILANKGKSIFITTPFVTFNSNSLGGISASNLGLKPKMCNLSLPSQKMQAESILNTGSEKLFSDSQKTSSTKNLNKNKINNANNSNKNQSSNSNFNNSASHYSTNNNNINTNDFNSNENINKNFSSSDAKNNINININTGITCSAENCFSSSKTSTFSINTNNLLKPKSIHCSNTNNININITNNSFLSGAGANSIININNFYSRATQNPLGFVNIPTKIPVNTNNNINSNIINNINHINNTNPILMSLGNFNTSLFQSLAAIDYKDPEKKKIKKRLKEMRIKHKRLNREGSYNCGRWQPEEHERFIEAIMKFGNEWKQVQKYVGTRSSTQARSHAQKFFVKIKRANILDFNIDLSKNSIKNLHEMANNLNSDQYVNAIKALNCVAFERKTNSIKRKHKKDEQNVFDSNLVISDECDGKINMM